MNRKKWNLGFRVALLFAVLTAGAGLTGSMDWKAFVAVFCASAGLNLTAYLMKHPIEDIKDADDPPASNPLTRDDSDRTKL